MRGVFVLIVGAGVAVAVGLSLWGTPPEPEHVPPHEGSAAAQSHDLPAPAVEGADALRRRLDRLSGADDLQAAADALLSADATVLADGDVRARLADVAEGLMDGADGAVGPDATRARLQARRLLAALYDCDAATRAEHDRALAGSERLHRALLFGHGAPDEVVLRHELKTGDRVWNLAKGPWKAAGITVSPGFVLHVNGIRDARHVPANGTLRVPREPLTVLIRKSRFELTVLLGGAPVRRYDVGIGANESTPVGTFTIKTRIEEPDWYFNGRKIPFGDPENVIGTRWMGFAGDATASGIGIHGTTDGDSIGRAVSLGCIRMRDADVEQIFEWIALGTEVEVRD